MGPVSMAADEHLTQPDHVEALLARSLEGPPERWRTALDSVCARHPQHAQELRKRFDALHQFGLSEATVSLQAMWRETPDLLHELAGELGVERSAATPPPEPADGRVLAQRYRLGRQLGQGAMGVVYEATDLELDRSVAVKVLRGTLFLDDSSEDRFLREAEVLAQLTHPHVVRLYDRGRGDEMFLVMELLEGAPLCDILWDARDAGTAGGLDPSRASRVVEARLPESQGLRLGVHWVAQVASGLIAAHGLGVLHRDVKPSNIFIRRDGTAVLLDFGIAARADGLSVTATDSVLGTPCYMAPEQTTRAGRGPAIDVYGLTACLYHVVTQRPPYEGSAIEVLSALQKRDPVPAHRLVPGLARDLRAILEKGMERDPKRRYPSVEALQRDLLAFLDYRPVSARPLTPAGRLVRRMRRAPSRWTAAATTVTLLVVLALEWSSHQEQTALAAVANEYRHLPPALALQGSPSERTEPKWTQAREVHLARLDRILAIEPADLHARLLRASLRLDRGDVFGAAGDVEHAATSHPGSGYLTELGALYRGSVDAAERGASAVDLAKVRIEPQSAEEKFAAAFHALRGREPGYLQTAVPWLSEAARSYEPARGLALLYCYPDQQERLRAAERVERDYGHATARTAFVRGFALSRLHNFDAAADRFRQSLELCPQQYGALHNLGVAYQHLHRLDEAAQALNDARELWPANWRTPHTLSKVEQQRGNFEAAYELASELPAASVEERSIRLERMVRVRVMEAVQRRLEGHAEDVTAAAQDAATLIQEVLPIARGDRKRRIEASLTVARFLVRDRDQDRAFRNYLLPLIETADLPAGHPDAIPFGPAELRGLSVMMPEEPSVDSVRLLKQLMRVRARDYGDAGQ